MGNNFKPGRYIVINNNPTPKNPYYPSQVAAAFKLEQDGTGYLYDFHTGEKMHKTPAPGEGITYLRNWKDILKHKLVFLG